MAEAERIINTPDTPEDGAHQAPEQAADQERERTGRGRRIAVLFAVAAFAYALDLISKTLVVAKLEGHAPIKLVGDLLELHAIRNPGAAFGFGAAFTVIFTVIAASVIVVIMRLARKLYSFPWAVALKDVGLAGFVAVLIFLTILVVGFVYEWKKGALDWE